MYNESAKNASIKYMAEKSEVIRLRVRKDRHLKEIWQAAAQQAGCSMTTYVVDTVNERIRKEAPELLEAVDRDRKD